METMKRTCGYKSRMVLLVHLVVQVMTGVRGEDQPLTVGVGGGGSGCGQRGGGRQMRREEMARAFVVDFWGDPESPNFNLHRRILM